MFNAYSITGPFIVDFSFAPIPLDQWYGYGTASYARVLSLEHAVSEICAIPYGSGWCCFTKT